MANRAIISSEGCVGRYAESALSKNYVVVRGSTADDYVMYSTSADDKPVGVLKDGADAQGDVVAVQLFGVGETMVVKLTNATVVQGELLTFAVDGSGKVKKVPAATNGSSYWVIGTALEDGVANQEIAMVSCVPYRVAGQTSYGVITQGAAYQTITKSWVIGDMTDNTNTTGYVDFASNSLPAGAMVLGWRVVTATGFTGDTTATIQIGVAGAVGKFSATTAGSVAAAGTVFSLPVSATCGTEAAATPRITITGGADFTSISAGAATATIFYVV